MIVSNPKHETAIVIRRDGKIVVFVRFRAGKLTCERQTESIFRAEWQEAQYSLSETLNLFLDHGRMHGCSQEALKGLEKLRDRDRTVVSSLF